MSSENLHTITYVSRSTADHDTKALLELLKQSRRRNKELNITGMLVYTYPTFMQVLEGPREAVRSLFFDKIATDDRHQDVRILRDETLSERTFFDWAMAFHHASSADDVPVDGFSEFLNSTRSFTPGHEPPQMSRSMLRAFQKIFHNG